MHSLTDLPSARPFVMVAQQSQFDDTRAPAGRHTGYAYCHVPAGSTVDCTAAIEGQMERFAPGFRDRILARHVMTPADLQAENPNYLDGAISGGVADLTRFFTRPVAPRPIPYAEPAPVHLLRLHPARWRRARHVRLLRSRQRRAAARSNCRRAIRTDLTDRSPATGAAPALHNC